jgi:hypothetical protein
MVKHVTVTNKKSAHSFAKEVACLGVPELVLRWTVEDTNGLRIPSIVKRKRLFLETYDTENRVTFSPVTNSFINHAVLLCRFLPRGIIQLGHAFLRLAEINQGESWHTT